MTRLCKSFRNFLYMLSNSQKLKLTILKNGVLVISQDGRTSTVNTDREGQTHLTSFLNEKEIEVAKIDHCPTNETNCRVLLSQILGSKENVVTVGVNVKVINL